jgi:four helix bundle protein
MREAAVSIPANIAEGHGRLTTREFIRFLAIADGSLRELDTFYAVSLRREYASATELAPMSKLMDEVGRMVFGLRSALKRKIPTKRLP